jgi:uncharacterized protein YjiS (DUF1127 family)
LPRIALARRIAAMQIAIEQTKRSGIGVFPLVRTWLERIRVRRALARIDARSLREAGISPVLAEYEANQPFWQPLRDLRD